MSNAYSFLPRTVKEIKTELGILKVDTKRIETVIKIFEFMRELLAVDVGREKSPFYDQPIALNDLGHIKIPRNICRKYMNSAEPGIRAIKKFFNEQAVILEDAGKTKIKISESEITNVTCGDGSRNKSMLKAIPLKPQSFNGIASATKYRTYNDYTIALSNAIYDRHDIPEKMKTYLLSLVFYFTGKITENELKDQYKESIDYIPNFSAVVVDFGELLAPLAWLDNSRSSKNPYNFNWRTATINIPLAGNEPLVDYYMKEGGRDKPYGFSVKALRGATNTVKASTFFTVYDPNTKFSDVAAKKALVVFKTLNDSKYAYVGHVLAGLAVSTQFNGMTHSNSFKVVKGETRNDFYKKVFKEINDAQKSISNKNNKLTDFLGPNSIRFARQLFNSVDLSRSFNKNTTFQQFSHAAEKRLIFMDNKKILNFTPLFVEHVLKNVIYVKMGFTGQGVPISEVLTKEQNLEKDIKLRSKNSLNGYQDALGIGVP